MDPTTIASIVAPAVDTLIHLLRPSARERLAVEANLIAATAPDSTERVRTLLENAKQRLAVTWRWANAMTVVLFSLFVGMAIAAVVSGLVVGKSTYAIVFGGVSATAFFTVLLWKPHEVMFRAATTTQRLEMVLIGLEEEWIACREIADPRERASRIREANSAALSEIAKLGVIG